MPVSDFTETGVFPCWMGWLSRYPDHGSNHGAIGLHLGATAAVASSPSCSHRSDGESLALPGDSSSLGEKLFGGLDTVSVMVEPCATECRLGGLTQHGAGGWIFGFLFLNINGQPGFIPVRMLRASSSVMPRIQTSTSPDDIFSDTVDP